MDPTSTSGQLAALKSAFATLSDVVVDETDALRTETFSQKTLLNSTIKDITYIRKEINDIHTTIRTLESNYESIRRDIAHLDTNSTDSITRISSTTNKLSETLSNLNSDVSHLTARINACESTSAESVRGSRAAQAELLYRRGLL
jgi:chromosome segregation ATPase